MSTKPNSSQVKYDGGTVQDVLDEIKSEDGSAAVGYKSRGVGLITTVKSKLDQSVSINDEFGPNDSGLNDATGAINAVAAWLAQRGGGKIVADPGVYKITGSVIVASNLNFEIPGVTFRGTGVNTVFQTGFLNGGALEENVTQWGTGTTGNGTHSVTRARVYGVKVENCAKAARLHRFNYGSKFEMCDLGGTDRSIHASHSWGQAYIDNFVRSPMQLQDFVDWTRVVGNSFEQISGLAGLIIGQDQQGGETTYGGSWTLEIHGNGFHFCDVGIMPRIEVDNVSIKSNHFESNPRHIYQSGTLRCENWTIEQNHLAAQLPGVIAIEMKHLRNSTIGKNDYVVSGSGSPGFNKRVILNTDSTFGNTVMVPYSTSGSAPDLSLYTLRDTNRIEQYGGSNNSALTQQTGEIWTGSGNFTVEKYRAKHRRIENQIPHCTTTYGVNTRTVDTFADTDTRGTLAPVLFNFQIGGATGTYRISGMVVGLTVTLFANVRFDAVSTATVTASNNSGKLRLVVAGLVDEVNSIRGFVKEM